jgi:hypothetical protein
MTIASFTIHSFRTELPRLGGYRTRIERAGRHKLLAVLFSSSVLTISLAAVFPYASYDFSPQVLLDDFVPQGEPWDYSLWIDEGSWLVLEVTSEVRLMFNALLRYENSHITVSSWTSYHGVVTLGEDNLWGNYRISAAPVWDGNVTVEIIDSSQSFTNSIHVLASPAFLLLLSATLVIDAHGFVRWLRLRPSSRRTRKVGIDEKQFADELRVSRTYLVLSWIRELKSRVLRNRETSEAS